MAAPPLPAVPRPSASAFSASASTAACCARRCLSTCLYAGGTAEMAVGTYSASGGAALGVRRICGARKSRLVVVCPVRRSSVARMEWSASVNASSCGCAGCSALAQRSRRARAPGARIGP